VAELGSAEEPGTAPAVWERQAEVPRAVAEPQASLPEPDGLAELAEEPGAAVPVEWEWEWESELPFAAAFQ